MKKINVLHTVDWFGYGGMERGVLKLLNGLDRRYYQPHLVAMRNVEPEIATHISPDVDVLAMQKSEGRDFSVIRRLADYIKDHNIDVVHSHNWGTWFYSQAAALLSRAPVYIHGEHGRDTEAVDDGFAKRVFKILLSRFCRQFTTVSFDIAEMLQQEWWISKSKIKVIENGIDLERFSPQDKDSAKKQLNLSKDIFVLGTVIGSFRPVKDLPTLFRALALVMQTTQNWRLVIVGGRIDDHADEYLKTLKALIAELGLTENILFTGPQKSVEHYMQAFDVYVNSSVYEGMSNTILEAMGCGAAILATNVGGTPKIIEHERTGFLVPHKSPDVLAAAINRLIRQPDLTSLLTEHARAYVQSHHSQTQFIRRHEELYESVMNSARKVTMRSRAEERLILDPNQAGAK